jgi:capsular polysaccharide biosynthesis protein
LSRDVLVRCAAIVAVFALVGGIIGYGFAKLSQPVYGARSEILYQLENSQPTGFLREDRRLSTQLVALGSREILAPVAAKNNLTYEQLAAKVHVNVLRESEILQVEVDDAKRDVASKLAGEIVAAFMKTAPPSQNASVQKYLTAQIAAVDAQLGLLRADANRRELDRLRSGNGAGTPEQLRIQAEIQSALDQRSALSSRLDAATIDQLTQPRVAQLTKAYVLPKPVSPKPLRTAVAGALAGFMLGLLAAMLYVRRRVAHERSVG